MADTLEKLAEMQGYTRPETNFASDKSTEKREKFVNLAESRTINVIRAVRTLAKLGNRANYEYDDRDVEKILSALHGEIDALKAKMLSPGARDEIKFKL